LYLSKFVIIFAFYTFNLIHQLLKWRIVCTRYVLGTNEKNANILNVHYVDRKSVSNSRFMTTTIESLEEVKT